MKHCLVAFFLALPTTVLAQTSTPHSLAPGEEIPPLRRPFPWSLPQPPPQPQNTPENTAQNNEKPTENTVRAYYPQDYDALFEGLEEGEGGERLHRVVEGDTLWKLAQTYLGDADHWPLLWAENAHIENPHWIFPGEVVYFKPSSLSALSPFEELGPVFEPPSASSMPTPTPTPAPQGFIGRPPDAPPMVAVDVLLTPSPLEGWASLQSSLTQAEMLSPMDEAYVHIKKESTVQPGETFLIFRNRGKIKHPKTKAVVGHMSLLVGAARLYSREGQRGMVQILRARGEILRGDMLGPVGQSHLRPIYMRKNEKALEGWVVAVEPIEASIAGGQSLVFLDKGAEDGVAIGNRFHIMRQQDGLSLQTVLKPAVVHKGLPKQAIALCTVVDLRPHVSTCLLIRATREIVAGDSVEMRGE